MQATSSSRTHLWIEKAKRFNQRILPIRRVLWIILGGWALALFYGMGAITFLLSIIGIPFGLQAFKVGLFAFCPVGYHYTRKMGEPQTKKVFNLIANIVWAFVIGWSLAMMHLGFAIANALTIIGIGNAIQHVRLIPLALFPFGTDLYVQKETVVVPAASMV